MSTNQKDLEIFKKFNFERPPVGVKFLLGDQGNPVLRFDYRWHHFFGSGDLNDMDEQEITVGLGIHF